MSVTINDVTHWLIREGKGHVVMEVASGWAFTACKSMATAAPIVTKKPKRICRKCRDALSKIVKREVPDGKE